MSSCYIYSRRFQADGHMYGQQITVYADSQAEADKLVRRDLAMLSGGNGDIAAQSRPEFEVGEIPLDAGKILTSQISRL